jgi:arylsulfatase A-like enzyme
MIWRWDAAGWTGSDARVVRNIDIAPTILGAVGATLPNMDGKSLAPLMTNTATTWQQLFAIERLSDSCAECPPTYCAVRTARHKYVRYGTGEEELYDLAADPYEMRSQHRNAAYSDVKRTLKQRARTLCSPLPPGMAPF